MTPKNRFYDVVVSIEEVLDNGKVKKSSVKYLVDAADTNEAEKNTMKLMDGTMSDWEITSISLSKIREVYCMND